jgi:hypothetical protein
MKKRRMRILRTRIYESWTCKIALLAMCLSGFQSYSFESPALFEQQVQPTSSSSANRRIGAVKAINGAQITLTPDSGPDVSITVEPATRFLRIAPGEKDLKNATPIQLQDIQVGDRILVGGKSSDNNLSLVASTVVVMKHSDLEARNQQELQDWQKRGADGLATAVDPAAGTVTISVRGKNTLIRLAKTTVIRRYAPDSIKFDDAKSSTLAEIHAGDQVRARGERSADGSELTAEEIVSGAFRNIIGTVNSTDASSSTLSVHDLLSRKNVVVKIAPDSKLRKLPPEMAQRIAMRLKKTAGNASAFGAGSGQPSSPANSGGGQGEASATRGSSMGGRSGGPPDFQQMLSRLPAAPLTDLHKGDAVIVLSTEGAAGVGTVVTLLSGVEPILQAAPGASGASILTPWSLTAPGGDAGP